MLRRLASCFALVTFLLSTTAWGVAFKPNLKDKAKAEVFYRLDLRTLLSDVGTGQLVWRLFSDKPGWMTLNTPYIEGTPKATDVGPKTFRISVVDAAAPGEPGAIAQLELTVEIVPVWPAGDLTLSEAREDFDYSFDLKTKVVIPGGGTATFAAISGKPGWMNVAADGKIVGRPARADVGAFGPIVIRASTASGFSDVNAFITVRKTLHPPKWKQTSFSIASANEDFPYSVNVSTSVFVDNFEQAVLTFSLPQGAPSGWISMSAIGQLTGTPGKVDIGPLSITGRLSGVLEDGQTYTSDATFLLNVIHTNHVPRWSIDPVVLATAPVKKPYAASVTSFASDPDNDALTFRIVSGPSWASLSPAGSLTGTPTNANLGVNEWLVEVSDGTLTATTHVRASVFNSPPKWLVKPTLLPDAQEDSLYTRDLLASIQDPDGDPVTFTILSGPPWAAINGSQLTGTPRGGDLDAQSFEIRVADGISGTDTATVTVFVHHVNHAPQWTQSPLVLGPTDEKRPFTSAVGLFARDIDAGDTLVFSKVSGPAWLSVAANGDLSGTPGRPDVGLNTFRIRAADQVGASAEVDLLITVTYINQAPYWTVAQINLGSANEDSVFAGNIKPFAKDDDAGDTLTFRKVSGPTWLVVNANGTLTGTPRLADVGPMDLVFEVSDGKLTATVTGSGTVVKKPRPPTIHGSALTFTVTERQVFNVSLNQVQYVEAQNGLPLTFQLLDTVPWVTLSTTGDLSASPKFAQIGTHQLKFRVADDKLGADGVLNIVVVRDPRPPVWKADPVRFETPARVPFSATVADQVSDLDGLSLTFAKKTGPAWLNVSPNGQLTGTPPDSQLGDNAFVITASNDLLGADGNIVVKVLFNNHAPTIDPAKLNFEVKERQPLQADLVGLGAANDVDNDSLTFTLVDSADWVQLSPTGVFTANPLFKHIGTHSFGFRVSDGKLAANGVLQVTVTRDPRPPVWSQDPITLFGTARVTFTGSVAGKAVDLDGLAVRYAKKSGPAWLTVNSDGTLFGNPVDQNVGDNTFLITAANDLAAADATLVVKVAFNPHPPVVQQGALSFTVKERSVTNVDLNDPKYVVNVDGTPLTFTLLDPSDFVQLTSAGLLMMSPQFRHIGHHSLLFRVANGSLVADGHIDITVTRDPRPPVWSANPVLFTATARVAFNDTLAGKATDLDGLPLVFSKKSGPIWLSVAANGALVGTPGDTEVGDNEFVVNVRNDLTGADGNVLVKVLFNPHPPVLLVDALKFSMKERQTFTENLDQPKYVTNVDGTPLTFSLVEPSDWVVLEANGTLTARPLFKHIGVTNVRVRVANGPLSVEGLMVLTVTRDPRPPVWSENPINLTATARLPFAGSIAAKAKDLDNLPTTFQKQSGPAWLTIGADGSLSGTPGDGDVGDSTFLVSAANDRLSATATLVVKVNFNPHPPEPQAANLAFTIPERKLFAESLNQPKYVVNPDGGPLVFTVLDTSDFVTLASNGDLKATPQFKHIGTHTLRFRVAAGTLSADATLTIQVVRDPRPPVWSQNPIEMNATARIPFTGTLAGKAADPDGFPISFSKKSGPAWLTVAASGALSGTPGDGDVGDGAFIVTVSNDKVGADATLTIHVAFNPHPPVLNANAMQFQVKERSTFIVDLSRPEYVTNVDGTALIFTLLDAAPWVSLSPQGIWNATPLHQQLGDHTFRIRVANGTAVTEGVVKIKVLRDPQLPVWSQNPVTFSTKARVPFAASLASYASDPDNVPLVFTKKSGPAWLAVAPDGKLFGTPGDDVLGDNAFVMTVSNDGLGADVDVVVTVLFSNHAPYWTQTTIKLPEATTTVPYVQSIASFAKDPDTTDKLVITKIGGPAWVTVAENGDVSGTPAATDIGLASVQVKVADPEGLSALATVEIPVVRFNHPPKWLQDPVLLADATEDAAYSFTLRPLAMDPDNDRLTFRLVTGPDWLHVAVDGSVTGNPVLKDVGSYEATLEVSDGRAATQVAARGRVLRKNLPPVVHPPIAFTVKERATLTANLSEAKYVEDPNGDALTFTLVDTAPWVTLAATGAVTLSPQHPHVGQTEFRFRVSDGKLSSEGVFLVTVLRDPRPPVWTQNPIEFTTKARDPFAAKLAGKVSDLDGAPLTFTKKSGPAWLSVTLNGDISGTPLDENVGDETFVITAMNDALGADVTVIIHVLFQNHPPTWLVDPVNLPNALVGSTYGQTVALYAKDQDLSDLLTFSKVSGPAWLSVSANGDVTGVPQQADLGLNNFRVRVADPAGAFVVTTVKIIVEKMNIPPKWLKDPVPLSDAFEGESYRFTLSSFVKDDDNDPLFFRILSGPAWLQVDSAGILSGTPGAADVGAYVAVLEVTDGKSAAQTNATGRVLPKAKPPQIDQSALFFVMKERQKLEVEINDPKYVSDTSGLPLTFQLVDNASWVALAPKGNLVAQPLYPQIGDHKFRFRVSNGQASAEAVLNIKVLRDPRPPVWATNPVRFTTKARIPFVASIAGKVTDLDGQPLKFSKRFGADWLSIDETGNLFGTPQNDQVGDNTFLVAAMNDGASADVTVIVTVIPNNEPPFWTQNPIRLPGAKVGAAYLQSLAEYAKDPDAGDVLTFRKMSGPDWVFIGASGTVLGTPQKLDEGEATVLVRITDPWGAFAEARVLIPVFGARPPRWLKDPIPLGDARIASTYTFDLAPLAISDDGLPLTFSKVSGPGWLQVAANGKITGTPTAADLGAFTAVFATTDGTFSVPVSAFGRVIESGNGAPIFVPGALHFVVLERQVFSENLNDRKYVYDPEGDPIALEIVAPPSWVTLTPQGALTLRPLRPQVGDHTFAVKATDDKGHVTEGPMFVRVLKSNDPEPVVDTVQIDVAEPGRTPVAENLWVVDNASCNGLSPISYSLRQNVRHYLDVLDVKHVQHTGAYLSADASRYDGRPLADVSGKLLLLWNDPQWASGFSYRATRPNNGHCYSSPIWSMHRFYRQAPGLASIYHQGYFTEHVPMDVLIATPHTDHFRHFSNGTAQATWGPERYATSFQAFEDAEKQPYRISVIAPECPKVTSPVVSPYKPLVDKTKGEYYAVGCSFDMAEILRDYAAKVAFRAVVNTHHRVRLSKTPADVAAIEVTLGGTPLDKALWRYEATTNDVVIDWYKIDFSTLKPGDKVLVKYGA